MLAEYGTVWHSMAQYGTVWHSMAQYGTVWHSMAQYGTVWHSMAQYGTVWHSMAQYGTVWHSMAQYGTVWHSMHQQKKKVTRGHTPCSLCVRRSRRIKHKLAFWVFGLLLGAGGQGAMPLGVTRRNQGLKRYPTQKGSPEAKRFSGRNPIVY